MELKINGKEWTIGKIVKYGLVGASLMYFGICGISSVQPGGNFNLNPVKQYQSIKKAEENHRSQREKWNEKVGELEKIADTNGDGTLSLSEYAIMVERVDVPYTLNAIVNSSIRREQPVFNVKFPLKLNKQPTLAQIEKAIKSYETSPDKHNI